MIGIERIRMENVLLPLLLIEKESLQRRRIRLSFQGAFFHRVLKV